MNKVKIPTVEEVAAFMHLWKERAKAINGGKNCDCSLYLGDDNKVKYSLISENEDFWVENFPSPKAALEEAHLQLHRKRRNPLQSA